MTRISTDFNAEIGYWLGEVYWRQGYTTLAMEKATSWLFEHTDPHRIYAGVMSNNPAFLRVLEKSGYKLEFIQ